MELRAPADAWQRESGAALPAGEKTHDLPDVVEVALRNNPETRRAWEDSRAAAGRYGRSLSAYYPEASVGATARPSRFLS